VELSATDEPLLLVPKQWQKSPDFFQLLEHRPVRELMAGRALSLRRRGCICCWRLLMAGQQLPPA
jgi:hypothetical protein